MTRFGVLIPAVGLILLVGARTQSAPDVQITDLRAHLFCDQTTEFTEDVISDQQTVLWNTIIGEGDAGCASTSTLILITVHGPPEKYQGDVKVRFLATVQDHEGETNTLVERTTSLGITRPDGFFFVPVWLYDTGCQPVDLYAWRTGARDQTERHETIEFMCGE